MSLRLPSRWLWDFWFARDGDDVHVFYLQAPRTLGDPDLRHHNATVGHAVSRDLRSWRVLPDALAPGAPGEFDDLATWTGSVLCRSGRWHLFYTGVSRTERGAVQRIGHAMSDDLLGWEKQGMVLEADPRFYEKLAPGVAVEHWRDPWVEWDEASDRFHMLLTAHAHSGPPGLLGVIGHATSRDGHTWEAGPPLSPPGYFDQLEVPQLLHLGGAWRILFSTMEREGGTHYLTGEAAFGPYALTRGDFLVGGPGRRHYAGRLIEHRGAWQFLAWLLYDERTGFVGELSDPMPLRVGADSSLIVDVR